MYSKRKKQGFVNWFKIAVTGIFLLISCFLLHVRAEGRELVDRVVAVVNDEIILLSELNTVLEPYLAKIDNYDYPSEKQEQIIYKVREDVLDQLINEKLTDQQVKKTDIEVSEQEIDAAIERLKQANRLTDETFREVIRRQEMSMEEYREHMRDQILRARLLNLAVKSKIVVTEEDIEACYLREEDKYCDSRKYHLRSILMKVPPAADREEIEEIRTKMEGICEKLEQGNDFTELAKKYAAPPLAERGGYLGAFDPETMASQIRNAVLNLEAGEFTPVLETDQGFQILCIDKIEVTPGKSLQEVSAEIEQRLYKEILDEKFNSWLKDLRSRSYIKVIR